MPIREALLPYLRLSQNRPSHLCPAKALRVSRPQLWTSSLWKINSFDPLFPAVVAAALPLPEHCRSGRCRVVPPPPKSPFRAIRWICCSRIPSSGTASRHREGGIGDWNILSECGHGVTKRPGLSEMAEYVLRWAIYVTEVILSEDKIQCQSLSIRYPTPQGEQSPDQSNNSDGFPPSSAKRGRPHPPRECGLHTRNLRTRGYHSNTGHSQRRFPDPVPVPIPPPLPPADAPAIDMTLELKMSIDSAVVLPLE
jgi:hypothetical protein